MTTITNRDSSFDEQARLDELYSLSILESLQEEDYDNITTIASAICNTQMSLISIIDYDRQWFKSQYGIHLQPTSRQESFCSHAIETPHAVMIVEDASKDVRFKENPSVIGFPHIQFYAGVPLVTENGFAIGTLCVLDRTSKELSSPQIHSLESLAKQVVNLLELRRKKIQLESTITLLHEKQHELERFAMVAAHDLKSPLSSMTMLIRLLLKEHSSQLDEDGQKFLYYIDDSATTLRTLIDGLLEYSRSDILLEHQKEHINIHTLMQEITTLFSDVDNTNSIVVKTSLMSMFVNKALLMQVLINIIANALKYNDKERAVIEVGIEEKDIFYEIYIQDNGPGIHPSIHEKIFDLFAVHASSDKFGKKGNGIGLATVKKIIAQQGGTIHVESEVGHGTRFVFTIRK